MILSRLSHCEGKGIWGDTGREGRATPRTLLWCSIITLACIFLLTIGSRDDAQAIPGVEGTFEYAFDAPWRIEPSVGNRHPISSRLT